MGLPERVRGASAMGYQNADKVHPEVGGVATSKKPQQPRRDRSGSSGCSLCHCLWCLVSFLVILIVLLGITALVIYLVLLPQLPKYALQDVAVTQLNVTNRAGGPIATLADLQSPVLHAAIAFTILVENPNEKLGIHYQGVDVVALYNGTEFAHGVVAPFRQGRRTASQVLVDMKASSAPLSERQGQELRDAIGRNDVPLVARIHVVAALELWSWVLPPGRVQVLCDLRISPPTAPHGTKLLSKSCVWLR